MAKTDHRLLKKINWRGFSLQLFLITVLPLTILLLLVAFGSQSLHHEAMRSLVGDRDLRAVHAAVNSLERELDQRSNAIQILVRSLNTQHDLTHLILTPEEVQTLFDGGLFLRASNGQILQSTHPDVDWPSILEQLPDDGPVQSNSTPHFSKPVVIDPSGKMMVLVSIQTNDGATLYGAFTPANLIRNAVSSLSGNDKTIILVIHPTPDGIQTLYQSGPVQTEEITLTYPGIQEVLEGNSGVHYHHGSGGEHVIAYSPVPSQGWGLVITETWEDISTPYLSATQSAPLVLVPVFLLALVGLWFGAQRIVKPLQKLEEQASRLADGDFDAIRKPVGGIEEIRNLQSELMDMAAGLKSAQESLHGYIGAITAGIENERLHLARELHDDTIQSLIVLNQRIQLYAMNALENEKNEWIALQDLVQQTMTNLRRMIRGLRPIYLEDLGLVPSLKMLVQETSQTAEIPISFQSLGNERRLDGKSEMLLYRITQEALNNILRHAKARQAQVEVLFAENKLTLQIVDDGQGFIVADISELVQKGHFGLVGMQERAEMIDADFSILSAPGMGTQIRVELLIKE